MFEFGGSFFAFEKLPLLSTYALTQSPAEFQIMSRCFGCKKTQQGILQANLRALPTFSHLWHAEGNKNALDTQKTENKTCFARHSV